MEFLVHAIYPDRLDDLRRAGHDEHGNPFAPYPAQGWEPLRCCLRRAAAAESVALIAYTHLPTPSPWAETGPVFVHGEPCAGYDPSSGLPDALRTGPRVLRTYAADRTLDYEHIRVVPDGQDIEADLRELVRTPGVAEVHVRPLESQCYLYAVIPA